MDYKYQKSEHAYTEQPYWKLEGSKMNVLNLTDKKTVNSQLRKYNETTKPNANRLRLDKNFDSSLKSDDWSHSLQYKVPINISNVEKPVKSVKEKSKRQPKNVFSIRKQGM